MVPHCSFDLHFSNSNTGLFFIGLLALCMSSLENVSLGLLPIFQLGCLGFLLLLLSCLYILEMKPLLVALFAAIFSHSVGYLFFLMLFFVCCAKASKFD